MQDRLPTQPNRKKFTLEGTSGLTDAASIAAYLQSAFYGKQEFADAPTQEGTEINKAFGDEAFFTTYIHSKTGTVHSLTFADGGNNIRFIATENFAEGNTFSVNGSAKSAALPSGDALPDGFFVSGQTVICFLNGNKLTFIGGGGGSSYSITSGTADPTGGADGDIYFQYEA
jgi:hypothetical protein